MLWQHRRPFGPDEASRFTSRKWNVGSNFLADAVVMACVWWLEDNCGDVTERLSDRRIWQMHLSAIHLFVTKSFGQMLRPLLTT
jgi:hypothetical protein